MRFGAQALLALGRMRYVAGNRSGAEALFRAAVAAEPSRADAHMNLGIVCEQLGRDACATEEYGCGAAPPRRACTGTADTARGILVPLRQISDRGRTQGWH